MKARTLSLLALFTLATAASADELRLKDGTKIVGTIVGFENDSFKVQTSYGFAVVRKDRIAAIIPSAPQKEAAEAKKPDGADSKKPAEPPAREKAAAAPRAAPSAPQPAAAKAAPMSKEEPAPSAPVAAPAAAPATPTSAAPATREEVRGNLYINHTYGFRMYKPPGWHVIEGAQKTLPAAIVAMGTGDETTLLVIGRERMKDSLDNHAASTERQLREIYENYRRLSEQRTRVAGLPALERRYRGTVQGHDWSGLILSLARGNEVFTILGMTYADSDLIQIQENVIHKAVASLEFAAR